MKLFTYFFAVVVLCFTCNINAGTKINDDIEKAFNLALQSELRPQADKDRDAVRKPQQVMQFAGIKAGMTILDLVASGGYYSEVLAYRVGRTGKVLAQNPKFILTVRDGQFNKEITQRLADNRLPNIERLDKEFGDLDLNEKVDVATMILNYHDLYNLPKQKRQNVLAEIKHALKPAGKFLIIDMQAKPGKHNPKLHRVHSQVVKDELRAAGFVLHKEGDFLTNPEDDHSLVVFDKRVRGKTDRFVLLFTKKTDYR